MSGFQNCRRCSHVPTVLGALWFPALGIEVAMKKPIIRSATPERISV